MTAPTSLASRLRLIVITDDELARPRTVPEVVEAAVRAGAPAIQLRSKSASARELSDLGARLREITRAEGALLFVNDRMDVALAIGADGVHVGPDDVPVHALRAVAPPGFLIGCSADEPDLARTLVEEGADYVGCGTVYPTSTKPDAGSAIGLAGLHTVANAVDVPVVGIGGVNAERAREIAAETGAAGVAVVGAVMSAADPARATADLLAVEWDRA